MNDFWNDPPEEPEPPTCCGDLMDVDESGTAVCPRCLKKIIPSADYFPEDADLPELYLP